MLPECIITTNYSSFAFTEGLKEQQKHDSASEKLQRAKKSLKRKFERVLQADVQSPESSSAKRQKTADDEELER